MRFKSIKLVNYIGIYNGMGINEIYIDFTKCKHDTVIIRGDNGSGKSTLFNALSPLPDNNDVFIPGLNASKEVEIVDSNTIYYIKTVHGVKANGDRDQAKAYIYKNINGEQVGLNPNGNITSFKDILYNEFKLDANFVALSQLSTEDRGLADKRPADRKRFVNAIIETLDTYNNINKTMTKRSSVFKSMINSITSKLDNIGDQSKLEATLLSMENRANNLSATKDSYIDIIATARSSISFLDPDKQLQIRFNSLNTKLAELTKKYNAEAVKIQYMIRESNIRNVDIEALRVETIDKKNDVSTSIQVMKNGISSLLSDREEDSKKLQSKIMKLQSLQSISNYEQLVSTMASYRTKIKACEEVFSQIGISDAIKISKDEYIIGLNTLKDIKEIIASFKDENDYQIMETALNEFVINGNPYPDIDNTTRKIDEVTLEIQELTNQINKWEAVKEVSMKLSMRPTSCKIDDCDFIKDAVIAFKQDPDKNISETSKRLSEKKDELNTLILYRITQSDLISCINSMNNIIRAIDRNKGILLKLPNHDLYTDSIKFFKAFLSGESFDFINNLYGYLNYANLFEEYKIYKEGLTKMENEYSIYQSKNDIIDEISKDIDELQANLDILTSKIEKDNNTIFALEDTLRECTTLEATINMIIETLSIHAEDEHEINAIETELKTMESNIDILRVHVNTINSTNTNLASVNHDLQIVVNDRDKIKHAIQLSKDYKIELEDFKARYNMIETIKFYSSPTKGIQLVFMELYMSKIISLANDLLQLLFEGRFVIQPFIINETEFRIPCIGNGYMNDDISSLSNGELSMISMIISFSLLYQSSTKYNVLKLDEIDAPLDGTNRRQFILVLERLMEILESEQCIMISHNTELDTSNVDMIILRSSNKEMTDANIIYQF